MATQLTEAEVDRMLAQARLAEVDIWLDILTKRKADLVSLLSPPKAFLTYPQRLDALQGWRENAGKTTEYVRREEIQRQDADLWKWVLQQPDHFESDRFRYKRSSDNGAVFRWAR